MKIEVSILASGSSGNAVYISGGNTKILIDAGLSGREIERRLAKIGVYADELDAILMTHEHLDHIKGVGVLSRRYDLPVYANEPTWQGAEDKLGFIEDKNCCFFKEDFMIGDLGISPFPIPHDANAPVGFVISCGRKRIGQATDMGHVSKEVEECLKGLDFLIIESNHDLEMLMNGTYPWHLKNRIHGEQGHLSNDDTADLLPRIIGDNFPRILLAHLSQDNNLPALAYITVKNSLEDHGFNIGKDLLLDIAHRDRPTELFKVG
ncbi:MAG: MBL fold metallo-hydrolase [Bacillota bacterium]|nr:MBL fold metallo-hydrolase [Bacillota bacterium]